MFKRIFIIILSITLISCNSPYKTYEPDTVISVDGSGSISSIDKNKGNVKITTISEEVLPMQIIIKKANSNEEITIGQLTIADNILADTGSNLYSKIFTFIPGIYTLILRPNGNHPENKYENLSFTAGSLEEYQY